MEAPEEEGRLTAVKGAWLKLPKKGLNRQILLSACTYQYPGKKRFCAAHETEHDWILPRETFSDEYLNWLGYRVLRTKPSFREAFLGCRDVDPQGAPTPLQRRIQTAAFDCMVETEGGVVEFPPGTGKTAFALRLMKKWAVPAVAVVHTEDLQKQWVKEAQRLLGVPDDKIGYIGGVVGKRHSYEGKDLVLAVIHSLYNNAKLQHNLSREFGFFVYDEVHHTQAASFRKALHISRLYRVGLSATHEVDGLESIFLHHLGPLVYQSSETDLELTVFVLPAFAQLNDKAIRRIQRPIYFDRDALRAEIRAQYGFTYEDHEAEEALIRSWEAKRGQEAVYARTMTEVAKSESYNAPILKQIRICHQEGRRQMLLSDRKAQLIYLHSKLGSEAALLMGDVPSKARDEAFHNYPIVLATTNLGTEGLNRPELDTLHVALPWSGKRRFVQGTGRIVRYHPQKKDPQVYLYDALDVPILSAMCRRFCANARNYGYNVEGQIQHIKIDLPIQPTWQEEEV